MECYSVIKKNEITPFAATWIQLESIIGSEVRKRKTSVIDITYMWNLQKWHKWTYLQNRNRLTDIEYRLMVAKREEGGERCTGGLGMVDANDYI